MSGASGAFRHVNPLSVFFVCLGCLAVAATSFDPRVQIAVIGLGAVLLVCVQRVSPFVLLACMVPFVLFGMGFVTTNVVFRQDSDFATHLAGGDTFSPGALSAGLTLSLRAMAFGMVSTFFAFTVDAAGLVRAMIAYLRFPVRIGYALFVAMQMVPDLIGEAAQMRMAIAMREGRRVRAIPGPFEVGRLIVPLLAFAVRRAGRAAIAMEARGFGAQAQRTMIGVPGFGRADAAFVAGGIGVIGVLLAI